MHSHLAYGVIGFGDMDNQFPYEFIGFGAMDSIWLGALGLSG